MTQSTNLTNFYPAVRLVSMSPVTLWPWRNSIQRGRPVGFPDSGMMRPPELSSSAQRWNADWLYAHPTLGVDGMGPKLQALEAWENGFKPSDPTRP